MWKKKYPNGSKKANSSARADYQKRVNETSRNKKAQELANEAVEQLKKEYTQKVDWSALTISQYDADNETYLVESPQLGVFALPVPISDAKSLKENWMKAKFSNQDYFINENRLNLAKLTIINR
jgi:hypothetical protein